MNINIHGFRWIPESELVSIDDVIQQAIKANGVKKYWFFFDRLYYIQPYENYYVGLFLTIKDQKKFTTLREKVGTFEITVESLGGGLDPVDGDDEPTSSRIMDFNFFVLNRATNRGVYSFYSQSCQISTFSGFFKRIYNDLRDDQLKLLLQTKVITSDKAEKEKNNTLKWSYIPRGKTYKDLLEDCKEVTTFEYTFDMITEDNQDKQATPFGGIVQTKTERVIFPKETPVHLIEKGIDEVMTTLNPFKGKAKAKTEQGEKVEIDIIENFIGKLDTFDYHKEVENMRFSPDKFMTSDLLKKMVTLAKKYDTII